MSYPDTASAIAVWADGMRRAISGVTIADLKRWQQARGVVSSDVWVGEHSVTHHRLVVKRRPDRGLLMSLYEQTAQICQVRVSRLDPGGEETEDGEAKAGEVMMAIGKRFEANELQRGELYDALDVSLDSIGVISQTPLGRAVFPIELIGNIANTNYLV